MPKLSNVHAREILDSRGNPTIEVEVWADNKYFGRAQVPSGASVGLYEAVELRDNNKQRFLGKGVSQAVENVNNYIKGAIIGIDVTEQTKIDQTMIELDNTRNKSKLGANAILGTSIAVAKASANALAIPLYQYLSKSQKFTLPAPMINIINGGAHTNNNLDIQEFMILPHKSRDFKEMIRAASEVFSHLKKNLARDNYSTNVGDEGGFGPDFDTNEVALDYITQAIDDAGYNENDFSIALDIAASTFYDSNTLKYNIGKKELDYQELTGYYSQLCSKYYIASIEDGMDENDTVGWQHLTKKLGSKVQLVGDDVFVTNPEILTKGINNKIANAILIKPNQIGTLTETFKTIDIAKNNNYNTIISHRSGETEDTTIAHLSVASNSKNIKTGSVCRSERTAKYNELIRIEEFLGDNNPNYTIDERNIIENIEV